MSGLQVIGSGLNTDRVGSYSKENIRWLPFGPECIEHLRTKLLESISKVCYEIMAFQRGGIHLMGQLAQLGCVM